MKKCWLITFIVLLFLIINNSFILAEDNKNKTDIETGVVGVITDGAQGKIDKNRFSGNIELGSNFANWEPGLDDEKVVAFDTEGLNAFNISGNLVYNEKSFFSFGYERPFHKTSSQEEIFKTNTSQESGLEKFTGGITLDPFANYFFPNNPFLKKLFSIKFKYTKELYFGEVSALTDFAYVPKEALVDNVNMIITGGQNISTGEVIAFKTEFIENEISLQLFSIDATQTTKYGKKTVKKKTVRQDLRLGYFSYEWNRPSHGTNDTLNGLPIVSENTYKVQGGFVAFITQDPGSPGWNLDWSLKYGFNGEVDNAFYYKNADVRYLGVGLDTWYNLYFGKDRYDGLLCTFGLLLDRRRIVLDAETSNGSSVRVLEDEDDLYKIYFNLSYRF